MMSTVRRPKPHPRRNAPRPPTARGHAFAALSGFSALVYELLWLKQLGLLFGNTAHAAAVGLTVFFLGLAIGGWFWGRRAARDTRPLRLYAHLELGIAAAALLYFALLPVYHAIYEPIAATAGDGFLLRTPAHILLPRRIGSTSSSRICSCRGTLELAACTRASISRRSNAG